MRRLEDKVALISGGARGQGAAEVKLFLREGAKVIFGDILDELGKEVECQLMNGGSKTTYIHLDVVNADDWANAVEKTVNMYGKIDILVNNAGIVLNKTLEETSIDEWNKVQGTNAKGAFLGTKAVVPIMKVQGGGSIVNISSSAGITGTPIPAYGASKASVRLLTKSTAIQYARENIRCNSIHSGLIQTEMTRQGLTDPAIRAWKLSQYPLGLFGTVEDVAYGALYLASDESSYVTGSELIIDGGLTAQ
jgi:NAD(P)-dependent dehydrogenase (short-subunit alcohol dehydrogenase family)